MHFPLYLAKRIYNGQGDKRRVSRPAIRIATAGVSIGLAVMLISVSIVLGFKHTIRDKVIGFGSHIEVADFLTLQSSAQYPIVMDDSMMAVLRQLPGVTHVQRFIIKQGILKTDNDFLGVIFKGVGPEWDSTFISKNLVEGYIPCFDDHPCFDNPSSHNKLLISQVMADKLHLKCNQKIFAYFIDPQGVRTRRFTIAGIYQTNLKKYDETICITDLYTANKLNGWQPDQASGAELTVKDFGQLQQTEDAVINKVNRTVDHYGETYSSATIEELNPQIFAWLNLMDMNVWIILGLMVAVASVTMISGLLIIILERTNTIGLLKALGATNRTIRHTFLWLAAFIIIKGILIGDAIALALLLLQRYTGCISLNAQTYYVSTVPIEFNWMLIILLNVATFFICLFVLIVPSFLISHIRPAKSIRYE